MMVVGLVMIAAAVIIMVSGPGGLPIPLAAVGLVCVGVGSRDRRRSASDR
jgi:hypothetical protein